MDFTWEDVQELREEAGLTEREVAALRQRLSLPRDPDGDHPIANMHLRTRLVLSARSKLLRVRRNLENKTG